VKKLFILISSLIFLFNINCNAKSIEQLKQEAINIKQESEQTNLKISQSKEEKTQTQKEIDNLDKELIQESSELDKITNDLEIIKQELKNNAQDLDKAKQKKIVQYELYKQRILFLYENGQNSYLKIIFDANNFADLLKRAEYMSYIIKYDLNLLNNLCETERLIEKKLEEIKAKEIKLKNLITQEKIRKENLEAKLKSKSELINQIDLDIKKYEQKLKELEKSSISIEQLINNAQSNINNKYTGGKLEWPVPGRSLISSGYGSRNNPISNRSEFHTGIDIPAPTGTRVVAAESGLVINSGNINGYGLTIIINHGNGLSTLYAHNSKLIAQVGDNIKRGDLIALVGSTGYSTGPHSHFEVRLNGKHTSPWNYLSK